MIRATIPPDEEIRLQELHSYDILGTHRDKAFDDLTSVAAALFDVPIAYISFIDKDRQWMKSTIGIDVNEVPREFAFCSHVVAGKKVVQVPDARDDERFYDSPYVTGEPNIRFYLGAPLKTARGNVIGTICVVDDAPRELDDQKVDALNVLARQVMAQLDLRRGNRVLLEERETFTKLFEAAPVPLLLVRNERVERSNRTFDLLVAGTVPAPGMNGTPLRKLLADDSTDTDTSTLRRLRTLQGEEIPVTVAVTDLKLGRSVYRLFALSDQSERLEKERVLEEARYQAENAGRIKDQFLSMVSHDLKSPLSGMFTMFDLLARNPDSFSQEEIRDVYRGLKGTTAVLLEMINQLLNIHRLQSGRIEVQREPVPVRMIADQIALSLSRPMAEKEITLLIDIDPSLEKSMDLALYREILFNLISNAIKFSNPGGTISIGLDGDAIVIADEGIGIPEEDIPYLFDKMQKTSRKGTGGEAGTGLGLPLVYDIIQAHRGTIAIDSAPGRGTRIRFTL